MPSDYGRSHMKLTIGEGSFRLFEDCPTHAFIPLEWCGEPLMYQYIVAMNATFTSLTLGDAEMHEAHRVMN